MTTTNWSSEIEASFQLGGRIAPEQCPNLVSLIQGWMTAGAQVDQHRLREFTRSVLWNADRRERRAQDASEWELLLGRRSAREGILGFHFLPRMDESVGLPRLPEFETLVRGGDSVVRPGVQGHRQRWAALRQILFRDGADKARHYKSATLFEYGRRATPTYVEQLQRDIETIVENRDELATLLADCIPVSELAEEWVRAYYDRSASSPSERFSADYVPRRALTSELDRNLETHGDASEFVADVTVPDGTLVARGATVTKTWRIKNAGTLPWRGRRLKRMTPHTNTFPATADSVPIPDTMPGEEVEISVDLIATHVEGSTELRFKMVDRSGQLCFPGRYTYGLVVAITTIGAR